MIKELKEDILNFKDEIYQKVQKIGALEKELSECSIGDSYSDPEESL